MSAAAALPGHRGRRQRRRRSRAVAAARSPRAARRPRPALRRRPGRRSPRAGVEVVDAPVSIAKDPDPGPRGPRDTPTPRSSRPPARSPRAAPTRSSPAARPAPRSPPGLFNVKRAKGIHRPALAIPLPDPGRAGDAARRRRQRRLPARAPRPVRVHGRGARVVGPRRRARRASALLSNGTEAGKGREEVVEAHERLAGDAAGLRLRRQRRGLRDHRGRRRRHRHRRLHRQRDAEGHRGRLEGDDRLRPRGGDVVAARQGRRRAAAARRCAACATTSTPRRRAAPTCSACAGWRSCRTARSARAGFAEAVRRAARGGARGRHRAHVRGAFDEAGALRRSPASDPVSSV